MEFYINKLTNRTKNYFEITNDKECLNLLKIVNNPVVFKISFFNLNLGQKLYGSSKKETKEIQKQNCQQILSFYKIIKKAVKIIIQKHYFKMEIFVEDLDTKKNNNDILLLGLLNIDFNTKSSEKMKMGYEYACDFLDAENSINNMCDFRDNKCVKHREKNIDKATGCCPNFCKLRVEGQPCAHKNLACKIFMCDYLIEKRGYYFTPHTIAVLKKTLSPLERTFCFGSLCKTEKRALLTLKLIRATRVAYIVVFALMAILFIL